MNAGPGLLAASAGRGNRYICTSCRSSLSARLRVRIAFLRQQSSPPATNPSYQPRRHLHERTKQRLAEAASLWLTKAEAQARGERPTMLSILEERGYINQIAGERGRTEELMRRERLGVYVGIDPTARSMHVGHLVPFMALFWMYAYGYQCFTLLGGATAAVGDPSGRTTSRDPMAAAARKENIACMHVQLKRMWHNVNTHIVNRFGGMELDIGSQRGLINNNVWLHKLPVTTFLRMLGNHVRVGTMLGRDTARVKMEQGDGLSFSELAYPLLQGWDWWQLYKERGVKCQIGGSDQMGNIMAGKEAVLAIAKEDQFERQIDDLAGCTPIGFTVPLLTTASGQKFGKSAGNAVWLDPEMTSVFEQYQFWVRTADADVERYLKLFTFLPLDEIRAVMERSNKEPKLRIAGNVLAGQVCLMLHGQYLTQQAKEEHSALFGARSDQSLLGNAPGKQSGQAQPSSTAIPGEPAPIAFGSNDRENYRHSAAWNRQLNPSAPRTSAARPGQQGVTLPRSRVEGRAFPAILKWTNMVSSRSEGARLIKSGGAYVGFRADGHQPMDNEVSYAKIQTQWTPQETSKYVIEGATMILRIGKWKVKVVRIVDDDEWNAVVRGGSSATLGDQADRASAQWDGESGEDLQGARRTSTVEEQWRQTQRFLEEEDEFYRIDSAERKERSDELKRMQKELKEQLRIPTS